MLLTDGYGTASAKDPNYNCIAWAAKQDQKHWWEPRNEPGCYWPPGIPTDYSIESFIGVFEWLGYSVCSDGRLEDGFEKVVIYEADGVGFTHVALQLSDGRWASKLGPAEDIEHRSPKGLESEGYGRPTKFLKRPRLNNALSGSAIGQL